MNTYKAFYRGKTLEVVADTSYDAQKKAAAMLKAKKTYEVTVLLIASADGRIVTQSTTQL